MSLSILCVTMNEPHAKAFILKMHTLATVLHAELVLGLDGQDARRADFRKLANVAVETPAHDIPLQEMVSDLAVNACHGNWVLRLDDDETVSPALVDWLASGEYERMNEKTFSFPRVYLFPDVEHYLTNPGMYPDLQTRLGRRECMFGVDHVHAPNPNGPGAVIYRALEHHKLLVRDYEARKRIAARYENIQPGAGTLPEYARYNLPEMFYPVLEFKEYSNGDFTAR